MELWSISFKNQFTTFRNNISSVFKTSGQKCLEEERQIEHILQLVFDNLISIEEIWLNQKENASLYD